MDVLDEIRALRAEFHLPFDDGYLVCHLAFRHKKGEYFVEFLLSGGVYLFLVGVCGV